MAPLRPWAEEEEEEEEEADPPPAAGPSTGVPSILGGDVGVRTLAL
jgi:hypothetical protein